MPIDLPDILDKFGPQAEPVNDLQHLLSRVRSQ